MVEHFSPVNTKIAPFTTLQDGRFSVQFSALDRWIEKLRTVPPC